MRLKFIKATTPRVVVRKLKTLLLMPRERKIFQTESLLKAKVAKSIERRRKQPNRKDLALTKKKIGKWFSKSI